MKLNFIIGRPGSGKSKYIYDNIIENAKDLNENHILIVPEQYTLSAQHKVCELSGGHGSFNIDVLSFDRLAYSVFMELGIEIGTKLDETGKSIVLRKVVYENKNNLKVYKEKADMVGFANQIKSIISEFSQYNIDGDKFDSMLNETSSTPLLNSKLADIAMIVNAYKKEIDGKYITNDDIIHKLSEVIADSEIIKNSHFYFDGFTGFTPIQYELIESIMKVAKSCTYAVTLKEDDYPVNSYNSNDLFSLSKETIIMLSKIAREINTEGLSEDELINSVILDDKKRYKDNSMISYLEENIFFRGKPKEYEKEGEDIKLFECDNPKEECEFIARDIVKQVRNNNIRYKDIAVVCSDLEGYSRYLTEYFYKYDIPAFIDNKKEILDNPFVDTISALLDIIETGFSFDSVFHYLKRNMTDIKVEEVFLLENYCIANGIKGKKAWTNEFYKKKGDFDDELRKLNDIRRRFIKPVMEVYDVVTDKSSTIKDITKALYKYCVYMDFQEKLYKKKVEFDKTDAMLSKEYEQVYKIVMDLFDSMVGLLGDEKCGARKFNEIFSEGLSTIKVGLIPNVHDQVMVGDIERSRVSDIKSLYVCGFNDGKVLASSSDNSIISETDRRFLKEKDFTLAPDDRSRCFINRFYLYTLLALPSDNLSISWSNVTTTGDGILPSSVVADIRKIFPNIRVSSIARLSKEKIVDINDLDYIVNEKIAFDILASLSGMKNKDLDDETKILFDVIRLSLKDSKDKKSFRMIENGKRFYEHDNTLTKEIAEELYALRSMIGITGYEKYAKCPYSQFLEIALGIREREVYQISSMDIGNMYHDCLEQFCLIINEKNVSWKELTDEQISEFVDNSAEIVSKKNESMQVFAEDSYSKFRLARIIDATVNVIRMIKKQIEVSKFTPKYFEYKVNRGRVDRVDVYEEDGRVYFRVVDYKSGSNVFDIVKVYNKLQLQLLAYINDTYKKISDVYREKEIIPVGGYYYHVDEDKYLTKKEACPDGKYDDDLAFNIRLVGNKLSGNTVNDENCFLITDEALMDDSLDYKDRSSKVVNITYKKDCTLTTNSEVLSDGEFKKLRDYIEDSMDEMKNDMLSGKNERHPYCYSGSTSCKYCAYTSICNFNPTFNKNDQYNEIKMNKNDVLDILRKED